MSQSEEENKPCAVCGIMQDEILVLSCEHSPCLLCAAQHHIATQPPNSQIYECSTCYSTTCLDLSAVIEMQRIAHSKPQKKKYDYRRNISSLNMVEKDSFLSKQRKRVKEIVEIVDVPDIATPLQPNSLAHSNIKSRLIAQSKVESKGDSKSRVSSKGDSRAQSKGDSRVQSKRDSRVQSIVDSKVQYSNKNQLRVEPSPISPVKIEMNPNCPDHKEEQLSYYCFNCEKPICAECAIHGSHRDHHVEVSRKAAMSLKDKLTIRKKELEQERKQMYDRKHNTQTHAAEILSIYDSNIAHFKCIVKTLQSLLEAKQRELIDIRKSRQEEMRTEIDGVSKMERELAASGLAINMLLQSDNYSLLSNFASKMQAFEKVTRKAESFEGQMRGVKSMQQMDFKGVAQAINSIDFQEFK